MRSVLPEDISLEALSDSAPCKALGECLRCIRQEISTKVTTLRRQVQERESAGGVDGDVRCPGVDPMQLAELPKHTDLAMTSYLYTN